MFRGMDLDATSDTAGACHEQQSTALYVLALICLNLSSMNWPTRIKNQVVNGVGRSIRDWEAGLWWLV